jgi:hypothetical protein
MEASTMDFSTAFDPEYFEESKFLYRKTDVV